MSSDPCPTYPWQPAPPPLPHTHRRPPRPPLGNHGDLRTRMARHHRDPDAAFRGWNDVWLSAGFRDWDLRPQLPGIDAPVLAVQGTADPYGSLVHVEAVRDAARGPVELLVLDCGHAPHLERPAETTAAVVGCVSAWTAPANH